MKYFPPVSGQKGFTLMEVLLAVTLFTIIISSSYGIFRVGMQIWKRAQGRSVVERKALFALERMGQDLRQALRTSKEKYKGEGNGTSFSLPSLIPIRTGKIEMTQYGFIRYRYDSSHKELCRSEISATDLYRQKESICKPIANHIQFLRFRYLVYDGVGESYSWYDEWEKKEKEEVPLAVEIQMDLEATLKGEKLPHPRTLRKKILIPVGEKMELEKDSGVPG